MNVPASPVDHVAHVRLLPDVRGVVYFAVCSCGWLGSNHPAVGGVEAGVARARANVELLAHVAASGS